MGIEYTYPKSGPREQGAHITVLGRTRNIRRLVPNRGSGVPQGDDHLYWVFLFRSLRVPLGMENLLGTDVTPQTVRVFIIGTGVSFLSRFRLFVFPSSLLSVLS